MNIQLDALLSAIPLERRAADVPFSAEVFVQHNGLAPTDYLEAFARYRGGAGDVGAAYLDLWEPDEVKEANADYEVAAYAPGFTVFASDGGDTAYAFKRDSGDIYAFPFIGMTMDEPATFLSSTLEGFLVKLAVEDND